MKQVVLIDAKNAVYRHGAVNPNLSRRDGFPTGALFGCLNSMLAIARRLPDASFVWVWDGDGETWRHKVMRENILVQSSFKENVEHKAKPRKHARVYGYKGTRSYKREKSESKYPQEGRARIDIQIPVLRLVLEGSGIRNFQIASLEGDDLLALLTRYLLKHTHAEVIIHSGDRDFYQLLKHRRVKILKDLKEGKLHFVDRKQVKQEYGVSVRDWVKFRAWTGDASDNIPHLRNVGDSIARKMLEAGLDPSLKYGELPAIPKGLVRFFEPNGIERTWPFVEQNFKLCKLVSRPDDNRLPESMREKVVALLSDIKFTRDDKRVNAEYYRRVSYLLMRYELKSILSQRELLWRIP